MSTQASAGLWQVCRRIAGEPIVQILLTIDWLALHGQMEAVAAKTGLMQRLAEILPARDRMILQFSWLIYPQCGN